MDYFSELMESYSKLKKRTFKLTYISEAEEGKKGGKTQEVKPEDKISLNQDQKNEGAIAAVAFMTANLEAIKVATYNNPADLELPLQDKGTIQFWMGTESAKRSKPPQPPGSEVYKGSTPPTDSATPTDSAEEEGGEEVAENGPQIIKSKSGYTSFGEVAIVTGTAVSISPDLQAREQSFSNFVGKFSAKADTGDKDSNEKAAKIAADEAKKQKRLAEEAEQLRRETLGVLLDEANAEDEANSEPLRFDNPEAIKALQEKSVARIRELCSKGEIEGNICRSEILTKQYIGGSREMSLEHKLVTGIGFTGFNDKGKMIQSDITEREIKDAFETTFELLDQMSSHPQTPELKEAQCRFIKDRIGRVGSGRVVLFTNPDGDGIPKEGQPAWSQGTPQGVVLKKNSLQESILERFTDCDIQTYQFPGGTNALNEVKGRFNEGFMGLMTRMFAEVATWKDNGVSQTTRKKNLKNLIDGFKLEMQDTLDDLQTFSEGTSMTAAMDIDSFPVMMEIRDQITTLTKTGEIPKVMAQLYVQMGGLIKALGADDIIPGGTAQSLGGKVDNFFLYTGEGARKRAEDAAPALDLSSTDVVSITPKKLYDNAPKAMKKAIQKALENRGLKITDDKDEVHLLSAGNKLSIGPDVKFGDLNLDRAMDIVMGSKITGSSPPADQAAWYAKLDLSLQFGESELGPNGTIAKYATPIKEMYDNCGLMAAKTTYVDDSTGETEITDGKQIAKILQSTATLQFPYGGAGSAFYASVMTTNAAKVTSMADLSDPDTLKQATESLKRDYLAYRFKKDYNGEDLVKQQGAIDSLCRIAGATILEMSEMGQIVTQEAASGKAIVINQNAVLRGLGAARKLALEQAQDGVALEERALRIEFSAGMGGTTTFFFKVKNKKGDVVEVKYKTNMERHKGHPQVSGKIPKVDAAKAGKTIDPLETGITGKDLEDDTMYQYMVGQMRLLETLINQAKGSHPL